MESGYYQIDSFRFLAFCLLGDDVEPCFEGSRLQLFEANKFQESITDFMEAIRNYNLNTSLSGSAIYENERKEEVEPMEKDIETMGAEVKTEDQVISEIETEPVAEETNPEPEETENFELLSNVTEQIHECLSAITVDMEWGPMVRYWYVDADLAAQMVYCFDVNDDHLYGFHYDLNGDALVIDFESRKRMKISIVEFVEGEHDPMMFVATMSDVYQNEIKSIVKENDEIGKQLDDSKVMVDDLIEAVNKYERENAELAQFKQETEANQLKAEKEDLFSKWECLIGEVEAFTVLRSDMDKYDVSYLEKELKCIFADTKANFSLKSSDASKEKKMNRIPVGNVGASTETEAYGGLYAKYGVKPIRD